MKKVIIGCKSVFTYMKYKILYGSRIQMAKINSLKGRIEIDLFSDAKCRIGNFLMTAGPFYIKCTAPTFPAGAGPSKKFISTFLAAVNAVAVCFELTPK